MPSQAVSDIRERGEEALACECPGGSGPEDDHDDHDHDRGGGGGGGGGVQEDGELRALRSAPEVLNPPSPARGEGGGLSASGTVCREGISSSMCAGEERERESKSPRREGSVPAPLLSFDNPSGTRGFMKAVLARAEPSSLRSPTYS